MAIEDMPLPGAVVSGRTVVASIGYTEDPEVYLFLLLDHEPPYFRVAHYARRDNGDLIETWAAQHMNIVPAVDDYQQSGGDY